MAFRHPRLWSFATKLILAILFIALVLAVTGFLTANRDGPVWPALGSAVALVGVGVTAVGVLANHRRQKRQDTLAAWQQWRESTAKARSAVFTVFGPGELSNAQASALVQDDGALTNSAGSVMSASDRRKMVRQISLILNGLERLAAGVYHGVYDIKILNAAGHTIIVSTVERYKTYIRLRQSTALQGRQQSHAFEAVTVLSDQLEILQTRANRRRSDKGLLAYMKGTK